MLPVESCATYILNVSRAGCVAFFMAALCEQMKSCHEIIYMEGVSWNNEENNKEHRIEKAKKKEPNPRTNQPE